jgi:hypothetical protein
MKILLKQNLIIGYDRYHFVNDNLIMNVIIRGFIYFILNKNKYMLSSNILLKMKI